MKFRVGRGKQYRAVCDFGLFAGFFVTCAVTACRRNQTVFDGKVAVAGAGVSSAGTVSAASAGASAGTAAAQAASGPPHFPNGYRPRRPSSDADYSGLSQRESSARSAVTSRGDGNTRPLSVKLKGYSRGASVRGSLQLFKGRVSVEMHGVSGRGSLTMQGTLSDEPIFDESTDIGVTAHKVVVARVNGRKAPDDSTFLLEGEEPAGRSHVAGNIPGADGDEETFDLWEMLPGEAVWFENHDKLIRERLSSPYDLRAVVEVSEAENVLFTETLGKGGSPSLISIGTKSERSALPVRHVEWVGVTCMRSRCETSVKAFRIAPELCVFLVRNEQEVCGMRCHTETEAALVVLTSDGFVSGPSLYGGTFWPALDEESTNYSRNALYWIDADGKAPLEILSVHSSTEGRETKRAVKILGYDANLKGFAARDGFSAAALLAVADDFAEGGAFEEY